MELTRSAIIYILSLTDSSIHSSKEYYIYSVIEDINWQNNWISDKLTFSKELILSCFKCVSEFSEFLSDTFKAINHKYAELSTYATKSMQVNNIP